MTGMQTSWDKRFIELAHLVATWSKDPSTKVGSVIVDDKRRVLAMGYNGFPRGVTDSEERYGDRDEKYPRVVHAELNAILNATRRIEGCSLYCTMHPCAECAKAIIQVGIRDVYVPIESVPTRWSESLLVSGSMLVEAGVRVHRVH